MNIYSIEDRECREFTNGSTAWSEYKMHPDVAQLVKKMRLGLAGYRRHSWRALSVQITGYECQKSGEQLEKTAAWTLGEEVAEWEKLWETRQ